ncbi:MAG: hypothetical protein SF066_11190 [Thermoanaerobaculia bacterium]|nr:hypothetical protein [Thermoanaerobaculia bacterium]
MRSSKPERMPEAETSLRLALYLLENRHTDRVQVAIDGAQVKTLNEVHFDIRTFLSAVNFELIQQAIDWRGTYKHSLNGGLLEINSAHGRGDVVATLTNGRTLRVEVKKGPLQASKSSPEYPLLREALGQLLTTENIHSQDLLAVAVPYSPKFAALAKRWREAPLVKKVGFQILTVSREDGEVLGLDVSLTITSQKLREIL